MHLFPNMGASEVILRQSFASTVFDSIALPAMFSIVWLKQYSSNSISRRCCKRQAMSRYPEYRTLNSTIRSHRGHIGSSPWADITQKQTDCEMLNFWRLCNSIYILKCFRQIQNCNNCFFFASSAFPVESLSTVLFNERRSSRLPGFFTYLR